MTANASPAQPAARSFDPNWSEILTELKLQLARQTYDTHLSQSQLVDSDASERRLTVALPTERSKEWVEHRLGTVIERVVVSFVGDPVDVSFVVAGNGQLEEILDPSVSVDGAGGSSDSGESKSDSEVADQDAEEEYPSPEFTGFQPISSNFTQTPDLFFDWVLPHAHGTVAKLVGSVIRQTIGTFIDKRHNRRREEWPANITVVMKAAGINSRASLYSALWDARADGYLVMRQLDDDEAQELSDLCGYPVYFTLRIRYQDEPADYPEEERPTYGPKRK